MSAKLQKTFYVIALKIQEFIDEVVREFGFTPTHDQLNALETFACFLADREQNCVMVMRGSAGTGKTSLAGAMVRTFTRLGQKLLLMAPTGRAAKVFAMNSGHTAFTIHRKIYREKSYSGIGGQFNLNDNMHKNTLFMIDEASMIGRGGGMTSDFGTGDLLSDLVQFVYNGQNCHMLLVGDCAQLPPVGEEEAPALHAEVLEAMGLKVYECDLREVLRQSQDSGILVNATYIRSLTPAPSPRRGEVLLQSDSGLIDSNMGESRLNSSFSPRKGKVQTASNSGLDFSEFSCDNLLKVGLPRIRFKGFADIVMVPGDELVERISSSYADVGMDETMVVTRSNKRANVYNQGIRATVLDREDELCTGDLLMVVKNKYLDKPQGDHGQLAFIANGDRVKVQRVRNIRELFGFRFADVWLQFPDYDDFEMQQTVILDTLTTEAPALTHEQQEQLYEAVMEDYADIPLKRDRMAKLKQDEYFNALQIKYAYAVTCHKAQGGQWAHVYIDQGYMTDDMLTPDYIHWLYTAFTRATEKLFLVNWPKAQTEEANHSS
ncbi:ATP-dependent DNA helicase [Segatella oris]|uniref:Predicted double-stranded RNA/RNA-DNA hybrid binding protein n=1 Tax=Segatella oris TaxID=28135 RepID=A0A448L2L5_9BACT|nr:AAA family ATPase [Segatella oris]VEH14203.1 Predicted double-stranded RNA/RNA-DNA hybrid binding protein [Segatella oris]